MTIIKKKTGETLIEVVVSLSCIMLAGAAAASIVLTALQTTVLSENYLVAQNLAMEAVEIVKNTRDTNYMRYPLEIDTKWLFYDDVNAFNGGDCYMTDVDSTSLLRVFTCNAITERFSPHENSGYQLYQRRVSPFTYSHDVTSSDATKFYRGIEVISADQDQLTMNVVVEWAEGAATRRFAAENVTITNFQ